jgi:hypothetical protein
MPLCSPSLAGVRQPASFADLPETVRSATAARRFTGTIRNRAKILMQASSFVGQ